MTLHSFLIRIFMHALNHRTINLIYLGIVALAQFLLLVVRILVQALELVM